MNRSTRHMTRACLAALVMGSALLIAPANAQPQAPAAPVITPPRPSREDTPPTMRNYLAVVIIIGLAVGANMIPSKRGHQD